MIERMTSVIQLANEHCRVTIGSNGQLQLNAALLRHSIHLCAKHTVVADLRLEFGEINNKKFLKKCFLIDKYGTSDFSGIFLDLKNPHALCMV